MRKLGHPVLRINVSAEQVQDRIDDAIQYFANFHSDAIAVIFHKHQITQEDYDRQWIQVPEEIVSIKRIIPLVDAFSSSKGSGIFDPTFQMRQQDLLSFGASGNLTQNHIMQTYLRQSAFDFSGTSEITQFTKYTNQLHIYVDWSSDLAIGDFIIIEATRILPGSEGLNTNSVYDDSWLKRYATELVRYQWAQNLGKYQNVQLVGGVTIDASTMLNEAKENILKLEEEIRLVWETPIGFLMG
jgi:hypothetical protein